MNCFQIFDKYYNITNVENNFQINQQDLISLYEIARKYADIKLHDIYNKVASVSFGSGLFGMFGHRTKNKYTQPLYLNRSINPLF
jgi:hypothetical protein